MCDKAPCHHGTVRLLDRRPSMSISEATPAQKLRLLPPLSQVYLLGAHVFLERSGQRRSLRHLVRHSVKKLPDAGMLTVPDLIFGPACEKRALVYHGDAVCDAERGRQLMSHDDYCHLISSFEKQ